jgi:hypothetical protein
VVCVAEAPGQFGNAEESKIAQLKAVSISLVNTVTDGTSVCACVRACVCVNVFERVCLCVTEIC